MSDFVYQLRDVTKEYNGRRVLQVDGLDIRPGEIFALVGPSGAGKSTMLRLLNFLEHPTTGRIHFREAEFNPSRPMPLKLRRRVTTVFQSPLLLNRSVGANVSYGLRLRGRRNSGRRVEAALKEVGLKHMARQRARTLSGGEAQRVALARAIVLQPDVLLLDEPTANLDPYNVGLIEDIVQALNRQRQTTVVLVTHNVFQAKRLAHRVALLLEGQIVEASDVEMFFESPRDPRTAAFVRGEMVY
ncbi:MAG: phosphate ABC transporter ATP-binding protein [Anaerolineales bacterium]|nr:MAG: phosphate ABC transporter ATP-binding protein [Anaerolineales bacterium]